jgi:hypothetical protein
MEAALESGVKIGRSPEADKTPQRLGRLITEVDRDQLRDAALGHGDAEQPVHPRHGDRVVRDDDEARVGRLVISSSRSQKRSTLWSSSGASTSSSTQIGAGLVRNTAKISASAVSACSPPESSDSVCGFLPGGLAMISRPASSGSSLSISCSFRAAAAEQR